MFMDMIGDQLGPLGKVAKLFNNIRENEKLKDPNAEKLANGMDKADVRTAFKCGTLGLTALAGLYAVKHVKRSEVVEKLTDPSERLHFDPIVHQNLCKLQAYRELEPELFSKIVSGCDHLIFLEHGLISKTIVPTQNDRYVAFVHFYAAVNGMNVFQRLVLQDLGNEHGKCASVLSEQIYAQLIKHVMNVLHMCSDFNIDNLLLRAPREVDIALQRIHRKKSKRSQNGRDRRNWAAPQNWTDTAQQNWSEATQNYTENFPEPKVSL